MNIPTKIIKPYFLECGNSECRKYNHWITNSINRNYICINNNNSNQRPSSWIDIKNFDLEDYIAKVKKIHKGSSVRHAKKADREGYNCKSFVFNDFVKDIVEINKSKSVRCGRPMSKWYRQTERELADINFNRPTCYFHYDMWWGIFGESEKLLAYIHLRRIGNYLQYSQILGHSDYLKYGIMYNLHFSIMKWISEGSEYVQNLNHLWYSNHNCKPGAKQWKEKVMFAPVHFIIEE